MPSCKCLKDRNKHEKSAFWIFFIFRRSTKIWKNKNEALLRQIFDLEDNKRLRIYTVGDEMESSPGLVASNVHSAHHIGRQQQRKESMAI